jgi:flagellar motor switch protein FliN/FliY
MDGLDRLADVPMLVEVELGRPVLKMRDLVNLVSGSVLTLGRAAGENLDVRIGDELIGFGEVVVTENAVAIRITDFKEEA